MGIWSNMRNIIDCKPTPTPPKKGIINMNHKYVYLFGTLLFFLYWFFLFIKLKEYRKRILFFSFLYGVIGVVFGYFYTADWWHPQNITGTRLGLEDFLLGFGNGGFAATVLLLFFEEKEGRRASGVKGFAALLVLTGVVTSALFSFFSLNSFYANCVGIVVSLIVIISYRLDLALYSFYGGTAMLLSSLPIYALIVYFFPGWVSETWMMEKLSGITFITIPIEDFIWYFLVGAIISIMCPFYKGTYYICKRIS